MLPSFPTKTLLIALAGSLIATQMGKAMTDEFRSLGSVSDPQINESSGIAASRNHPGHVWVHNDSGDQPRLFLLNPRAQLIAIVAIESAEATDWEDMCSFRLDDTNYLLVGDIGDNNRKRDGDGKPFCRLYLLKEPKVPRSNGLPTVPWNVQSMIDFEFEDGPHDCEGLAFDAQRKEVLLITKTSPGKSGLYSLSIDFRRSSQRTTAKRIASPFVPFATCMDVSPDGRQLIVGSMFSGMLVRRSQNESWKDAFSHLADASQTVDLPQRKQGETVCFDPSGKWLYLNSEGKKQPLWIVPVPQAER